MPKPKLVLTQKSKEKFSITHEPSSKKDITSLHAALVKLRLKIDPAELKKNELGKSTRAAIKKIQKQAGLKADGKLTPETGDVIKVALDHIYYAGNKTRMKKIQEQLGRMGIKVDLKEIKDRSYGKNTKKAIMQFQQKAGMPADGRLNDQVIEKLNEEALKARLTSKTQIGQIQHTLLRVLRISRLKVSIKPQELKQKTLGPSVKAAIMVFQKKYSLQATGEIDQATYDKMLSVAASRPLLPKLIKVKSADQLSPVSRTLRLNMTNKHVGQLQQSMAFLGYKIDEKEFKMQKYGKTTLEAIKSYQRTNGLPVNGHVEGATKEKINLDIKRANPGAFIVEHSYRIRGCIRDDVWQGRPGLKVQVRENVLRGEGSLLGQQTTLSNGFFDVPYDPPRDPADKQIKSPFHLKISVLDQNNKELINSKVLFNPTMIAWVNFTEGSEPYRGVSDFEQCMSAVKKVLGNISMADIQETTDGQEITQVALNSGLTTEGVMRLALSYRAANKINNAVIQPEVCYAFIGQNLPPSIPGDLLAYTEGWTLIDQLVNMTVNGLVFMDEEVKLSAFDNAIKSNLIPIAFSNQKSLILNTISTLKQNYALEQPLLVGNGSLVNLLNLTSIGQGQYNAVAQAFLSHKSLGPEFWSDLKSHADIYGGLTAVNDFETTVSLGHITKNHMATLSFLKNKINNPAVSAGINIRSARDLAKLTHAQWVSLINENGGAVPEGTDGAKPEDKVNVYANILASQSEQLFPSIAFTAIVKGSNNPSMTKIDEIANVLDSYPEIDLRTTNLDKFVKENKLIISNEALGQARVMQRIHRIAPTALVGKTILDNQIYHSSHIVSMGKERFVKALTKDGIIDKPTALTVYSNAEFQYARVLTKIADYRFEFHRADPGAIIDHTYSDEEQQQLGIPNLEILFGSQDFCCCKDCQSVYSPSAYLVDVLRFLGMHDSEYINNAEIKTVEKLLLERRPDVGDIKLNSDNTDTPIPYIDLVCEILENAVCYPDINHSFSFQTQRTAEELRAFPENVRKDAYDLLKIADYPMDTSFNLWQEEARIFLQHLGINRYELMETFQAKPQGIDPVPSDVSIAGEFFGISSHEADIIDTQAGTAAIQNVYWKIDTTRTEVQVSEFIKHAKIDYPQLLQLMEISWINSPAPNVKLHIERRPIDCCDPAKHYIVNLTTATYDRIHRFLRLWRHTDLEMWELDLLIRAEKIGYGKIDQNTLIKLKQFKQAQDRFGLSFDAALSFFHEINTEPRQDPEEPQKTIQPLYIDLFQNPAITNPVDATFSVAGEKLSAHKATLLAAFSINDSDLALILQKTDDSINIANLTLLYNYINLAKGLGLPIKDLLTLLDLAGVDDIFVSPKQTLDFAELFEWVKVSGFAIQELDYLLNYRPDSPFGLREETITQYIQALRTALSSNTSDQKEGLIISQIATTLSLSDEQTMLIFKEIDPTSALMQQLADAKFIEKNSNGDYVIDTTPGNFQNIYTCYGLLSKIAMMVNRYKLDMKDELQWILAGHNKFKLLDFGALPINGDPVQPLFESWMAMDKWLYFKALYPEPENASLRGIFDLAADPAGSKDKLFTSLNALTSWSIDNLILLDSGLKLQYGANADYVNIDTYIRLLKCFKQINRLGVKADVVQAWANRDNDVADAQFISAQQIIGAAKSKYDYGAWLSQVTPLQDDLREKKRSALINFLIERSLRTGQETLMPGIENPAYWKDSDDLLGYFLIDVEMSACQLTSRIKQAISSTQMFVQRCFLNLEQPYVKITTEEAQDTVSLNSWKQWKWMKNYRIWEANRKVFLYPENWIEPELRDDKSQFFEELENEIQQNEVTREKVETAFLHYLQKVHDVSRIDIVGVYHELDDDNPCDNLPPNINILHVVGRTKSQPAIYYYRQFDLSYNTWTAWEKIDLEIIGDHVIPVVYDRKLYLFWLIFMEKPQKIKKLPPAKATDSTADSPELPNKLEIQLAWSARKDGGWTSKKISSQKLIHPWERPLFSYNLKPRYKTRENQLWLDVYISTSLDFNNKQFFDAYNNSNNFVTYFRYNETARPWHSSSFVFDGEVVDVKIKALAGKYHILNDQGVASDDLVPTDSYNYIHDNFGEDGRLTNRMNGKYEIAPRLVLPDGMHYKYTHLANNKTKLNASRMNVLENNATRTLLESARSPFELIFSQDKTRFDTSSWGQVPFFYQDNFKAFFIKPEWQEYILGYNKTINRLNYIFYPFYHPYTGLFIRELNRSGIEGLLKRNIQINPGSYSPGDTFNFSAAYSPDAGSIADITIQNDIVDFSRYGAYSIYNWEIFFHAPLMIACKLSQNQRFQEAMDWFHYIFDPTNTDAVSVPQRYWVTKPFYEENSDDYRKQRIENLLEDIGANLDVLREWKNNPFKPHLIARSRPVAYQKSVVMKYIDNLIAWGDQLFRQDTIESINQATLLYVLAFELLGPRPVKVPNVEHNDYTYNELIAQGNLDEFGNDRVEALMENFTGMPAFVVRTPENVEPIPKLDVFYFCIPNNTNLLDYWKTVEDRLFKIRHCMNIEGVVRQLPLFEPPIDPMLLVKAAAAGVDLDSVLSNMGAPAGQYRFRTLEQRALEFCSEVKALGDKLLASLEKKDSEGLALLHSVNEINLQEAVREVRKDQIKEAKENWDGLEKSKDMAEEKKDYYSSRQFINANESVFIQKANETASKNRELESNDRLIGYINMIPGFSVGFAGFGGSPSFNLSTGPSLITSPMQGSSTAKGHEISAIGQESSLNSSIGSFNNRFDEWKFQATLADKEIKQLEKQIEAARIRYMISEKELENQELQIENAQSADEYLRSKYTSQQLYDWTLKQLATVYFQSYQLAFDMAKRAEKSFQMELGKPDASFIQFGYWDSLKKGLLAGEKLATDIRRMETAYYDMNQRELEITKHISIAQVEPMELLRLKETGLCTVKLPEWLFDMDYPGQYRRRVKSVSITIPCVTGPYTSLNCKLALTNNVIRTTDSSSSPYGDPLTDPSDTKFYSHSVPVQSIATSNGQNDSGVFELNFNDERYLPFEGAGVISEWQISLPKEYNQFDFNTISDVILHIRYTAKDGSQGLYDQSIANLAAILPKSGTLILALNRDFSGEWHRFLYPGADVDQELDLTLKLEHLPFYMRNKNVSLTTLDLMVESSYAGSFNVKLQLPAATSFTDKDMSADTTFGGIFSMHMDITGKVPVLGDWRIKLKKDSDTDTLTSFRKLSPDDVKNAYLILGFSK